ncbi:hypothetical protein JCM8097_006579 [Rhodosporidiobolus ruineniae]
MYASRAARATVERAKSSQSTGEAYRVVVWAVLLAQLFLLPAVFLAIYSATAWLVAGTFLFLLRSDGLVGAFTSVWNGFALAGEAFRTQKCRRSFFALQRDFHRALDRLLAANNHLAAVERRAFAARWAATSLIQQLVPFPVVHGAFQASLLALSNLQQQILRLPLPSVSSFRSFLGSLLILQGCSSTSADLVANGAAFLLIVPLRPFQLVNEIEALTSRLVKAASSRERALALYASTASMRDSSPLSTAALETCLAPLDRLGLNLSTKLSFLVNLYEPFLAVVEAEREVGVAARSVEEAVLDVVLIRAEVRRRLRKRREMQLKRRSGSER